MNWNAGDELDFGDEDDVGVLLAKARSRVPPSAGLQALSQREEGIAAASRNQRDAVEKSQQAVDVRRLLGDRRPTVSSGSIRIKQQVSSSTLRRLPDQPLANVTNSQVRVGTTGLKQVFQAPRLLQENETTNGSGLSPVQTSRLECDAHARQASDERAQQTSAQSTSSCRLSQEKGLSAAEKGKRLLEKVVTGSPGIRADGRETSRRIPGPAGAVQRALAQGRSSAEAQLLKPQCSKQASQYQEDEDFCRGPWLAALDFVRREGPVQVAQLRDVRKGTSGRRIAQLVVIVKSMMPTGEGDVFASVKDATGSIECTLHRKILADKQLGPITVGTALVLKQVAVFRPVPRTCYLNITKPNVVKVFPSKTRIPALATFSNSSQHAPDPALAEPNWDDSGSPRLAGLVQKSCGRSGVEQSSFCGLDGPSPFTASVEPRSRGLSDSAEAQVHEQSQQTASERQRGYDSSIFEQVREPLQPGSRSSALPCNLAGQPPSVSHTSFLAEQSAPERCAKGGVSERMSDGQARPDMSSLEERHRRGGDPRTEQLPSKLFPQPATECPNQKRGREHELRTAAQGPEVAAAAPARGPIALRENIQQLLAGLDDDDWFLTGDEVPPTNKKPREVEELLPL